LLLGQFPSANPNTIQIAKFECINATFEFLAPIYTLVLVISNDD
jgi:hypothetical protein